MADQQPCKAQQDRVCRQRRTGRSVVVRINDRGPFVRGRVIDITPAAAHAIGFSSLAPVSLTVIGTDPAIVGVDDDGAT